MGSSVSTGGFAPPPSGSTVPGLSMSGAVGNLAVAGAEMMIGLMLDAWKGKPARRMEGPEVFDLGVQTEGQGAVIPTVFGSAKFAGNLIWNAQPVGNAPIFTMSLAIGVCRGPVGGITRIWVNDICIHDRRGRAYRKELTEEAKTLSAQIPFTIYLGSAVQNPDPTIVAGQSSAADGLLIVLDIVSNEPAHPAIDDLYIVGNTPHGSGRWKRHEGYVAQWDYDNEGRTCWWFGGARTFGVRDPQPKDGQMILNASNGRIYKYAAAWKTWVLFEATYNAAAAAACPAFRDLCYVVFPNFPLHLTNRQMPTFLFEVSHPDPLLREAICVGWGDNSLGEIDVPLPDDEFIQVSAGTGFSMGLRQDGTLIGWGSTGVHNLLTIPEPNAGFTAVSCGAAHVLALRTDGTVVAWGDNTYGQCTVPTPNDSFSAVSAGGWFSLGLKENGSLAAWGLNNDGECTVPTGASDFIQISAGYEHALALRSTGVTEAWGLNTSGQTTVPPGMDSMGIVQVSAGGIHSLALEAGGGIHAWGGNGFGQTSVPSPNSGYREISAGWQHSLGRSAMNGTVVGWGRNTEGQCDVPSSADGYSAISAGGYHSLGLQDDAVDALADTSLSDAVHDICLLSGLQESEIDVTDLATSSEILRGYLLDNTMQGRAALAPLQEVYGFDGLETDGQIHFLRRRGVSAGYIPLSDLAAHEYGADRPQDLTTIIADAQETPAAYGVSFIDQDREYKAGTVYCRMSGSGKQIPFLSVPMTMTLAEARRLVCRKVVQGVMERQVFAFALSRKYLYLNPGDVRTIVTAAGSFAVRIMSMTLSGGVLMCEGVLDSPMTWE